MPGSPGLLEERFPETVEAEPELLAQHCTEAGLVERAVDYWQRAGQQALARSAMAEAVAHLTKGLEVLTGLPAGSERQRRELGLQLALGQASIAAKGFAAPETGRAYARASELCRELGDVSEFFPALYGQSIVHFQRGELAVAHEAARDLLQVAENRSDAAALVTGHRIVGSALYHLGRLVEIALTWRRDCPSTSLSGTAPRLSSTLSTPAWSACSGSSMCCSRSAIRNRPGRE